MWIVSSEDKVFQTEFQINSQIYNLTTENGNRIDVFDSKEFNKVFLINNKEVVLDSLSFIYAETLSHLPVCSHHNPKKILLVGSSTSLVAMELAKHKNLTIDFKPLDGELLLALDNFGIGKKVCERMQNINLLSSIDSSKKYDVIIYDALFDENCKNLAQNSLSEDGLIVAGIYDLVLDKEKNGVIFEELFSYASVSIPFYLHFNPTYPKSYVLCSKKYHPVADMNFQRAEMIEGLKYYNRYIHQSCFEMPKFILQKYKGLLKQ